MPRTAHPTVASPPMGLFRTHNGETRKRLKDKGYKNHKCYSGHSPRRGAAQHAADNGILEYDIQRLGRWSSEAFKGYSHISQAYKFHLNRRFQTGRSVPVIHTSLNVPNGQPRHHFPSTHSFNPSTSSLRQRPHTLPSLPLELSTAQRSLGRLHTSIGHSLLRIWRDQLGPPLS